MLALPTVILFLSQLKTVLIWLALVALVALVLVRNVRIVPEQSGFVIERLGRYHASWQAGLHVKVPLIDRVAKEVSFKDKLITLPPLAVLSQDGVTLHADLTLHYRVCDLKAYSYGAENPLLTLEEEAARHLREQIEDMPLQEALSARKGLLAALEKGLKERAQSFGLAVLQVTVNNLVPPASIQQALDQARLFEREEEEKDLQAQAKEQALIRQAKAEQQAALIRAQAQNQLVLEKAKAKAQAWLIEQEATAQAVEKMQAAGDDRRWVTVTGLKALIRMAENQAANCDGLSDLRALVDLLGQQDVDGPEPGGRDIF